MKRLIKKCDETSRLLKALAHPQRLQILCHLSESEKTVSELENLCGASQSAVSQFLNRMKLEGLVLSERERQFVKYRIADKRVEALIGAMSRIFCK